MDSIDRKLTDAWVYFKELRILYGSEFFITVIILIALLFICGYCEGKIKTIRDAVGEDNYRENEEGKKYKKIQMGSLIIAVVSIVCVWVMPYFTNPSLDEQEKIYVEWGTKLYSDIDRIEKCSDKMFAVFIDGLKGKVSANEAIDNIKKYQEELHKINDEIIDLGIPKGLPQEKRKILAHGIVYIDEGIGGIDSSGMYFKEALHERDKIQNGNGNKSKMEESAKQGGEARQEGHRVMSAVGLLIEIRKVEEEFGIIYDGNKFVKMKDFFDSLVEQNNAKEKKQSAATAPAKPSLANSTSTNTSSNLETAKKQLEYRGIMGNVTATSYGHSSKGFLAQFDDGNVVLLDKMTNRVIRISPLDAIKRIADYKGNGNASVRLELLIMNDTRDSDEASGVWKGNNHLLPVTVEYKYENGAHIPGMIKSGAGASPAAYDNYLYETKNVDMVNMIIEEAAALK